jgi:tetratricopeptide (TPR) repeat protein
VTVADSRIDELRRRLERDPGSRLFAQLAEEYRKAGEHAEAIRVARAGLVQHPSYASARLTLGRALLDSRDPAGARVELEAALRDAPDNILASRFLGQALDALGELGPALTQLQNTLKMAPGDRQLESQIVSIQTRLRSPQSPPVVQAGKGVPASGTSELTAPSPRPAAPAAAGDAEAGPLPPTIRIRMPVDRGPWARTTPLPPPTVPPASAPAAPPPASAPAAPPPASGPVEARVVPPVSPPAVAVTAVTPLGASPPQMSAEPFYESDVAQTLPTAYSPGLGLADVAPAPTLPPGAVAAEETVFEAEAEAETPPEPAEAARPAPPTTSAPEDAATGAGTPFSSSTLAELYFRQGLVDRAVEVYRQVLDEEPGNERARSRLADIENAPRPTDARAGRRAALERTIAGLEALLLVVQRRRPWAPSPTR